jgi:hypothetical protein
MTIKLTQHIDLPPVYILPDLFETDAISGWGTLASL